MSLVVVDDDENVRQALRRLLKAHGHEVRVFGSAEDLELEPGRCDCLIVDVRLPGATGFELKERLALSDPSIPVVLMTGHGGSSLPEGSEGIGTELLAKPFDETELLAAITQAVAPGPLRKRRG